LKRQNEVVTPWTTRFTRSRIAPGVFNFKWNLDEVPWNFLEQLLADVGLPTVTDQQYLSNGYRSTPILGGFRIELGRYGFGPSMPTGERIVGFDAFRLLCVLLDLEGPRRLKGEPPLRTEAELRDMLRLQVAKPEDELLERAKLGLGIYRAEQVRELAQVAEAGAKKVLFDYFDPDAVDPWWSTPEGKTVLDAVRTRRSGGDAPRR